MPLLRSEQEYVNATEASALLEVSYVTFQKLQEEFHLKSKSFPGQGRQTWFLKTHIELVRDNPDKAKELARNDWQEVTQ